MVTAYTTSWGLVLRDSVTSQPPCLSPESHRPHPTPKPSHHLVPVPMGAGLGAQTPGALGRLLQDGALGLRSSCPSPSASGEPLPDTASRGLAAP